MSTEVGIERRQHRRQPLFDRVARIDTLGNLGLCRLQNVSDGGMMINTPIKLSIDNPVRISFDCTNRVQGRVAWQRGDRAGIRFLQPIETPVMIRKVLSDCRSRRARSPRLSISCPAQVTSESGSFSTVIGNVSQQGVSIIHGGDLEPGTPIKIWLASNGLALRGTVRWSVGLFAGVELAMELPAEQLAIARAFSDTAF